jgi:hypothetical protein
LRALTPDQLKAELTKQKNEHTKLLAENQRIAEFAKKKFSLD